MNIMPNLFLIADAGKVIKLTVTKTADKKEIEVFTFETGGEGFCFLNRTEHSLSVGNNGALIQLPDSLGLKTTVTYDGAEI
jgi:hypothetical protein